MAAALTMLVGCRGMTKKQAPIHPNPNMDNVTYIEPQEPSDFWDDGRGMRPQIDGTVARGSLDVDLHMHRGIDGDAWATTLPEGLLERVPVRDDETPMHALMERGQQRFDIYCAPCHGEAGLENGGVVPRRGATAESWSWSVPSLHGERQRAYPVGALYDVIANGYNTMPGYAAQIPVEDRWAIATYLRAMQVSHGSPANVIPSDIRPQAGAN